MSKKKKRGVPTLYSESKVKVGVSLTPTGAKRLGDIAKELGLSRSEFVERIARGEFDVSGSGTETTITLATGNETDSKSPTANLPQQPVENQTGTKETQSSDNQAAADLTELQERYQTLKSQSQQQTETINNLNQQLEKLSQLESQLASSVPTSDYNSLQKELEKQTETIENLSQQLEKVSQLESQLASSVPTSDYNSLQKELEKQTETIENLSQQLEKVSQLESQLASSVPTSDYNSLQQKLEEQLEKLSQLESQLAESIPTSDYNSLQKELEKQTETIENLNQQLEKISQLESQLASSVPTSDYNSLQQKLEEQEAIISQLKQELEHQNLEISELKQQVGRIPELETQLAHSVASQTVNSPGHSSVAQSHPEVAPESHNVAITAEHSNGNVLTGYSGNQISLQQTVQEQEKTIRDLQKQIVELQRVATIGEARLSKWRHYNFSR